MVTKSKRVKQSVGGENFLRDFISGASSRGDRSDMFDFRPFSESGPSLSFGGVLRSFGQGESSDDRFTLENPLAKRAEQHIQGVSDRQDIFSKMGLMTLLSQFGDIFNDPEAAALLETLSPTPEAAPEQGFSEDDIRKLVQEQLDEFRKSLPKAPKKDPREGKGEPR